MEMYDIHKFPATMRATMIVAVPVEEDRGPDSEVAQHFGRARYFAFVDVDGGSVRGVTVKENPHQEHGPGDLPKFVREHGARVVIAYGMGPRAVEFFNSYGIEVVTGASGRVVDVVKAYVNGSLSTDSSWRSREDFEHEHEHGHHGH
jgi:predicted Fe-Mo cluster-binding NifX family protein